MSAVEKRRRWAYALISRCASPPVVYGSREFLALPDGPEKVASVVVAAESWAREGDDLLERLRIELDLARAAHKADEDAEYVARRDGHRKSWDARRGQFKPDPDEPARIEAEWLEWLARGEVA